MLRLVLGPATLGNQRELQGGGGDGPQALQWSTWRGLRGPVRQELSVRQEATEMLGRSSKPCSYLHQKLLRIRCSLEVSHSRKLRTPEGRQRSRDSTDGSCASVLPASAPCTTPQPPLASGRHCVCLDMAVAPDGL